MQSYLRDGGGEGAGGLYGILNLLVEDERRWRINQNRPQGQPGNRGEQKIVNC